MQRREFIGMTTSALATGMLGGFATQVSAAATSAPTAAEKPMDAAAFHAARRFIETRFGNIAYIDRGSGEAALFLHGFPLNSFQWRGAIDRLSSYRRCIAPDYLGLGYTQVADGQGFAPSDQVDMLVTLLDKLGIQNVDVIANDSGCAIAQLLVTRHPDRVRTLLLTNGDTENECPPPAVVPVIELSKEGKFVDQWLAPWLADKKLGRSAEGIGGQCYANPANPTDEAIDTYFAPLVNSPRQKRHVHAYAIALEQNSLEGIGPALKRCTVPTRILWGTADTIFSPASADYLDQSFGNSRGVRRLSESKLFWPEERPDVIADEALRLWGIA